MPRGLTESTDREDRCSCPISPLGRSVLLVFSVRKCRRRTLGGPADQPPPALGR